MTPVASGPLLLRIDEVAERLAVSRATAYRLVQRGLIPTIRIGTSVRVAADALDRWVQAQVTAQTHDA